MLPFICPDNTDKTSLDEGEWCSCPPVPGTPVDFDAGDACELFAQFCLHPLRQLGGSHIYWQVSLFVTNFIIIIITIIFINIVNGFINCPNYNLKLEGGKGGINFDFYKDETNCVQGRGYLGQCPKEWVFFWDSFPKPVALNIIKTSKDAINFQTAVPLLPNILYHSLLIEVSPIMRFMSGMGLGLVLATTSVYIVEIATTDMRVRQFAFLGQDG